MPSSLKVGAHCDRCENSFTQDYLHSRLPRFAIHLMTTVPVNVRHFGWHDVNSYVVNRHTTLQFGSPAILAYYLLLNSIVISALNRRPMTGYHCPAECPAYSHYESNTYSLLRSRRPIIWSHLSTFPFQYAAGYPNR